jgi:3D (Asp-Asp-Asp) domain-containing protein
MRGGPALCYLASLALVVFQPPPPVPDSQHTISCRTAKITGYVRTEFSSRTYDGTSITTPEPIVAASWNIPIDSHVWIEGLGTYRVADRGHLGYSDWIDVAVWTRDEAYAITSWRTICVSSPA